MTAYYNEIDPYESISGFIKEGGSLCRRENRASTKPSDRCVPAWLFDCSNPSSIIATDGVRRPVGQVRAFGNAIVPQVAAQFIGAMMS